MCWNRRVISAKASRSPSAAFLTAGSKSMAGSSAYKCRDGRPSFTKSSAARPRAHERRLEESPVEPLDVDEPRVAHELGDARGRDREIARGQDFRRLRVVAIERRDLERQVIARPTPRPDLPQVIDRKSTRLNSSHIPLSRMPSS